MAKTRIYIVSDDDGTNLVEASSAARAVSHMARRFVVTVASAKEVASLMSQGVVVQQAGSSDAGQLDSAPEIDL